MAIAGHLATIGVSTGSTSSFLSLDGAISFSLGDSSEMLDFTDFADGRLRRRLVGLRDLTASIDGDVEAANTGYQLLRAAYVAGDPVVLQILHDGTNGVIAEFVIGSFERSASVDGKVEFSCSLEHSGSWAPGDVGTGF